MSLVKTTYYLTKDEVIEALKKSEKYKNDKIKDLSILNASVYNLSTGEELKVEVVVDYEDKEEENSFINMIYKIANKEMSDIGENKFYQYLDQLAKGIGKGSIDPYKLNEVISGCNLYNKEEDTTELSTTKTIHIDYNIKISDLRKNGAMEIIKSFVIMNDGNKYFNVRVYITPDNSTETIKVTYMGETRI